jgi:hypothetical protein
MSIERYLRGLGSLCSEVSSQPRLLPVFLAVLRLVPGTIAELQRESRRRLAA